MYIYIYICMIAKGKPNPSLSLLAHNYHITLKNSNVMMILILIIIITQYNSSQNTHFILLSKPTYTIINTSSFINTNLILLSERLPYFLPARARLATAFRAEAFQRSV